MRTPNATALNKSIRAMNENRKWMEAIKARDQKCVRCGKTDNLESHHQPSFADLLKKFNILSREDARRKSQHLWSLDFGITLCTECHYAEHGRVGAPPKFPRIIDPVECIKCGTAFVVRPSLRRGNWGKCCSRKCVDSARSEKHAGIANPNWKGGLQEVECLACKSKSMIKAVRVRNGGGRFCSRSCLRRYYNENR